MSSGRDIRRPVSDEDIRRWEQGWAEMMVTIWREKILAMGIVDTRSLYGSLSHRVSNTGGQVLIAHEFLTYGIFVARGVGRGYTKGNPGNLEFLGKGYRREHGLDKPRKRGPRWGGGYTSGQPRERRDWFSPRYLSSIEVLTRVETQLYGHAYMGTLSNVVQAMFGNVQQQGSHSTVTSSLARL